MQMVKQWRVHDQGVTFSTQRFICSLFCNIARDQRLEPYQCCHITGGRWRGREQFAQRGQVRVGRSTDSISAHGTVMRRLAPETVKIHISIHERRETCAMKPSRKQELHLSTAQQCCRLVRRATRRKRQRPRRRQGRQTAPWLQCVELQCLNCTHVRAHPLHHGCATDGPVFNWQVYPAVSTCVQLHSCVCCQYDRYNVLQGSAVRGLWERYY